MRNQTNVPPDLLPPQDVQPSDNPIPPDLEREIAVVDPKEEPLDKGTEFYPEEILDEDPELGGPEGVANEASEADLMESVAEIRPDLSPESSLNKEKL